MSVLDEPSHGLRMRDEMADARIAGVVMRVEVNDDEVVLAVHVRKPGDVRILDRVIAADDDRDGTGLGDLTHHPPNRRHAALDTELIDRRIAVVDRLELVAPVQHHLHAAGATAHRAQRGGPFARAAIPDAHVHGRADDRHFDFARLQVLDRDCDRQPEERERAVGTDWSGIALRIA
jgi:hypothetical protein